MSRQYYQAIQPNVLHRLLDAAWARLRTLESYEEDYGTEADRRREIRYLKQALAKAGGAPIQSRTVKPRSHERQNPA